MVDVAVLGATGYAGAEALRILTRHPAVRVTYLGAHSQAGTPLVAHHPQLAGYPWPDGGILGPTDADRVAERAEIALLALPSRASGRVAEALVARGIRVVDLSGDLRLAADVYREWYGAEPVDPALQAEAVYGLTEWARDAIGPSTRVVSNPGCFATAVALALLPLNRAGLVDPDSLAVDAKSGISGAGRGATLTGQLAELEENLWAYRVGRHQHVPEIERALALWGQSPWRVHLVTHVIPAARGILATVHGRLVGSPDDVAEAYRDAYAGEPFVRVLEPGELPPMKGVRGSNRVDIGFVVDRRLSRLVVVAVLDNLVKGAAGQAIQNLNRMIGVPEDTALDRVGWTA
ncbi:MAG: N-acetyl-gamma-glutamyl-phosphate reductase [Actinomycetia bacterium]|nr:N-acetyl-gamma-glutamyl-phosphate reductase [Actinomycetes bacterium]